MSVFSFHIHSPPPFAYSPDPGIRIPPPTWELPEHDTDHPRKRKEGKKEKVMPALPETLEVKRVGPYLLRPSVILTPLDLISSELVKPGFANESAVEMLQLSAATQQVPTWDVFARLQIIDFVFLLGVLAVILILCEIVAGRRAWKAQCEQQESQIEQLNQNLLGKLHGVRWYTMKRKCDGPKCQREYQTTFLSPREEAETKQRLSEMGYKKI